MLELLMVMGVLGVLVVLVLPAISLARESARRTQCTIRLRELGLALHQYHDSRNHLPEGWRFDPSGATAFGWASATLPFLGGRELAERIDVRMRVDAPWHDSARQQSLPRFLCPSDIVEPSFVLFAEGDESEEELEEPSIAPANAAPLVPLAELPTANYVGVFGTVEPDDSIPAPLGDGVFLENRQVRFASFLRGLSHTFIIGERTMAQIPSSWFGTCLAGEDAAARLVGSALQGINNPLADECDFSSRHPGGANFLWGDGHVSFVSQTIQIDEYHQCARLKP